MTTPAARALVFAGCAWLLASAAPVPTGAAAGRQVVDPPASNPASSPASATLDRYCVELPQRSAAHGRADAGRARPVAVRAVTPRSGSASSASCGRARCRRRDARGRMRLAYVATVADAGARARCHRGRTPAAGPRGRPSSEPHRVRQRGPRPARHRAARAGAAAGRRTGPADLRQRGERAVGVARAARELSLRGVPREPAGGGGSVGAAGGRRLHRADGARRRTIA